MENCGIVSIHVKTDDENRCESNIDKVSDREDFTEISRKRKSSESCLEDHVLPKKVKISTGSDEVAVEILSLERSQESTEEQNEKIEFQHTVVENDDKRLSDQNIKTDENKENDDNEAEDQDIFLSRTENENNDIKEVTFLSSESDNLKNESLLSSNQTFDEEIAKDNTDKGEVSLSESEHDTTIKESGTYLYRLLRKGERIQNGLFPKTRSNSVDVVEHVAKGSSGYSSKYISTSKTLSGVLCFRGLKKNSKLRKGFMTIVRIDVGRMEQDGVGFKKYDLTYSRVRQGFISKCKNLSLVNDFERYAKNFDEVLIELDDNQANIPTAYLKVEDF